MNFEEALKDMVKEEKLELKKPCNHPIVFVVREFLDDHKTNMYYDCICLNCKERKITPASIYSDFSVVDPNNPCISHENTIDEYLYAKKQFHDLKYTTPLNEIADKIEENLIKIKKMK